MTIKRVSMTLQKKMEIIQQKEQGSTTAELAKRYNRAASTISTILANKETYIKVFQENKNSQSKSRLKKSPYDSIEQPLYEFFKGILNSGLPINGNIIRTQAKTIASSLGIYEFDGTSGWFSRFKNRFGIRRIRMAGEAASVNDELVCKWKEDVLPELIKGVSLRDIYNVDESAFYWKILSHHTYGLKGEASSGLKTDKSRFTVIFTTNMDGSDVVKPVIIGHSKNPRCFSKDIALPCIYKNNENAWCTIRIFNDYLHSLNERFKRQNRNIILFLDNCSAHSHDLQYSNIRLEFFPPNTTSILQPLDRGIISWIKRQYTDILTTKFLNDYIAGCESKITLLDAICWLCGIWNRITPDIITNCFKSAGFSIVTEESENNQLVNDEDMFIQDTYTFLEEKISKLAVPVSEPVKEVLKGFISTLEESKEETSGRWECSSLMAIKDSNIKVYTKVKPSEPLNDDEETNLNSYNQLVQEAIKRVDVKNALSIVRVFILESKCQKLIDEWFFRMLELDKEIDNLNGPKKYKTQSILPFLRKKK